MYVRQSAQQKGWASCRSWVEAGPILEGVKDSSTGSDGISNSEEKEKLRPGAGSKHQSWLLFAIIAVPYHSVIAAKDRQLMHAGATRTMGMITSTTLLELLQHPRRMVVDSLERNPPLWGPTGGEWGSAAGNSQRDASINRHTCVGIPRGN